MQELYTEYNQPVSLCFHIDDQLQDGSPSKKKKVVQSFSFPTYILHDPFENKFLVSQQ